MGGWLDTDDKIISVQSNLTETATGSELGKRPKTSRGRGERGLEGRYRVGGFCLENMLVT